MCQVVHVQYSVKVAVTLGLLFFSYSYVICDTAAALLQKKNQINQEWFNPTRERKKKEKKKELLLWAYTQLTRDTFSF